ncbi:GntR family transcriptional regulator [uncultured Lactobacillus sp.]|uniref:GntR family transcriptional regulator n=1 Tax=uncultured Lactobacillus sp. TaxID=153152 RepID=UPI0026085D03|nr:GntR family transcriptional regulator [uncultured Lactobacillus sp.]
MSEIKYEKVKKNLIDKIESGIYKVGEKLPTESELMKTYQVSRYTIRRAAGELENKHYIYRIQGGGMYVDDWKKAKSKRVVDTKMIGIVTTHLADYIFPRIISGIDRVLSQNGYSLILSNTHNNPQEERKALKRMLDNNVAGLIIEPTQSALPNKNLDLYRRIQENGIPALLINSHTSDPIDMPYLEVDDLLAEEQITNYLIGLGHKKILGMFQVDDMQGVNRLKGYLNAYMQHPTISYLSQSIMYQSTEDMDPIFQKAIMALQGPDRPTAIVCYNDELAIRMMNIVKSLDLKIPEDISIVGFDNYILGKYITPRLTTVDHPKERMGVDAANMIIKMINGEAVESKQYKLNLIKNNSVIKNVMVKN